jgi:hypothetical protein
MDQSKAKEGKSFENACEALLPQPTRKKKKMEDQRLEKAFELLTACSNQTVNDECQQFGNMIAAKLRYYNETVRCAIQYEIMNVFLKTKRGFMNAIITPISSQLTHLKPTSQLVHLKCTLKASILRRTRLFHPSVLKTLLRHVLETLLRHQSVSATTQFCLTVFPQKASRQLRHLQKKILMRGCL